MTTASRWRRLSLPLRVGLIFAAAGIILAIVGIVRGAVPPQPLSILLALLISGGSWGVVSWAVTTAIVDVETDLAEDTPKDVAHDEHA
ncbi:MAG: hypothetical protein MUC34_21155 [Anaerolineae bacterium]|jgi:hypothetical protein|nr:hypothetical protein [Anaerolineae bacterium]